MKKQLTCRDTNSPAAARLRSARTFNRRRRRRRRAGEEEEQEEQEVFFPFVMSDQAQFDHLPIRVLDLGSSEVPVPEGVVVRGRGPGSWSGSWSASKNHLKDPKVSSLSKRLGVWGFRRSSSSRVHIRQKPLQ